MSDSESKSLCQTRHTLLDRVKDPNNEEAWKEFISYYEQYIYNILRSIRINDVDAQELCQDIIVKLWKKLPDFSYDRDRGKFRSWLGTVIRNDANKYFNKNTRHQKVIESRDDEDLARHADPQSNYDMDQVIVDEWNNYVSNLAWQSIKERFKDTMQNVFLMHAEGKSYTEIAQACDIKESSVRSCVTRIRNHLKDEIKKINEELL